MAKLALPRYYLDSCILLALINNQPEECAIAEALLSEADDGKKELWTSEVTIIEVAFAESEKRKQTPSADVQERIDKLWHPASPLNLVEVDQAVAYEARGYVRDGALGVIGIGLKPMDAIHLATAKTLGVEAFFTYDDKLWKLTGKLGFRIEAPNGAQLLLPLKRRTDASAAKPE